MGKLFKYEWKKQMFSKIVIGVMLVVLIAVFLLGTVLDKENWQAVSMVLMVVVGSFGAMYVGIESLLVLNRDLRTKESHMLFMVPRSAYQILGAKLLAAMSQILFTAVLFFATFFICFTAYLAANQELGNLLGMVQQLLKEGIDVEVNWKNMFLFLAELFVSWVNIIAIGFLAIISVRTVLVKTKLATPIAVVVFLILSSGMNWISNKIWGMSAGPDEDVLYLIIQAVVMGVISVVMLLASGWMAEKKLSV